MNKDRLIELLLEEVTLFWEMEMGSYLDDKKSEELDKLIKEYDEQPHN